MSIARRAAVTVCAACTACVIAFGVSVAGSAGALDGCATHDTRGSEGFVLVPLVAFDASADGGGDAGDVFSDGGSYDAGIVRVGNSVEPAPPRARSCQNVVSCRPEADAKLPHPVTPEFDRCTVQDGVNGTFSSRETREARAKIPGRCCYIAYRDCSF